MPRLAVEHASKVVRVGSGPDDAELARTMIRVEYAIHETLLSVLGAPDLSVVYKEQLILVEVETGQEWLGAILFDPFFVCLELNHSKLSFSLLLNIFIL